MKNVNMYVRCVITSVVPGGYAKLCMMKDARWSGQSRYGPYSPFKRAWGTLGFAVAIDTKQRVLRCVLARARVFRARADSSQLQRVHGFGGNLSSTLSELGLQTVPTSTT
jgi:hypothetical protein